MAIFTSYRHQTAPLLAALLILPCFPALAAPYPAAAAVEQTARALLLQKLEKAGLEAARVNVKALPPRGFNAPSCPEPVRVAALDERAPSRMRLQARCDAAGWDAEFIVRAEISARVAVAARDIPARSLLDAGDIEWMERPVLDPADMVGAKTKLEGLSNRTALRQGQPLRLKALEASLLVKRGEEVRIVARNSSIEVVAAGEALGNGRQGEIIRVRNSATGKVIRARASQPGEVNPVD
ncbi:flagella basal body P-ring formation protein FlgA [Chromobacterium alkanivorans]|uniref:flagellar basal body P-ring formation chaperone FlgA n=1 Tax=Chromobacterium alkanivorans TaxID=1071719 RepID=UPI00216788AA|nr:flagellar basal body P-ring formation chaperone FlgA [Chromobacterium alkanivorans]MCS3806830.1 flagella basal body P-ring formation protein FlgA [Chromobacterium alkanivorans]MCS3821202.1 flagella basal body P-ring formation protein FlgA [Chromobacterium alkanivorans]MCS3876167.1 flagella basal body P-ring formation protein FlgA [Chromobacterium alkanivorans]